MHFCQQELIAIMMVIPCLGYFLLRGKHLFHRVFHRKRQLTVVEDGCCKHEPPHGPPVICRNGHTIPSGTWCYECESDSRGRTFVSHQ